ncbi:MAG TPA: TIGR03617 family F420-dependent LLM class oxidoreductase [Gammaproteobacteria bacterium]|nr:TIGR03617 family F420-dependent LLM class oxidoreductase [Gammaproteobacteria bacterium]
MKIDSLLPAAAPAEVMTRAQALERDGFDCVWTFEAAHDAFLPLAFAAHATKKLEIGTNIAVAFARTPFAMAQMAWDLQRYSDGRFRLGLGTQVRQHVERRLSASFDHPAARVTDYIRCVRAIWRTFQTGAKPDYQGPFYQFKLINDFFNPGPLAQPEIPIYLAGVNPRMCRAGGEVADGFHVHPVHTVPYLKEVVRPAIDEGARTVGRSVADLELYSPVFVITGDTEAERADMERAVRRQIAFYASTPSYAAVLEFHGHADLGKKLGGLLREGRLNEMGQHVPDALLEEIAVFAPPAELGSRLRRRYEGVLDRIALYSMMGGEGSFKAWRELTAAIHA